MHIRTAATGGAACCTRTATAGGAHIHIRATVVARATHITGGAACGGAVVSTGTACRGTVVIRARAVTGLTTQHRVRVAVNRRIHPPVRAVVRSVTGSIARRLRHAVNVRRIVVVTMVPRCGTPVRHVAQRRQRRYREDCSTRCRVAIHRATV